ARGGRARPARRARRARGRRRRAPRGRGSATNAGRRGPRARARAVLVGRHRAAPRRDLRARDRPGTSAGDGVRLRAPRSPWVRALLVLPVAAAVGALLWWRGPSWGAIGDAFTIVRWQWVLVAIGFNLLSVLARSLAWRTVIHQAMPPPVPGFLLVFSAFSVGLFANAVLPGRIGELARVAVLTRKLPGRRGAWASLLGTVFAHRLFDLVPSLLLVIYVLLTAKVPHWAYTSLEVVLGLGFVLMNIATLFPLWPGNVGLVQAAVALPLISYGVAKAHGIAFGFGLQGIEASVGVGVGMLFLAREGLSFAMLRVMPGAEAAELPEDEAPAAEPRARARIPG